MPVKIEQFKAGGGQGGDVLSQVDAYIEGRPKPDRTEVDSNGNKMKPSFLDQVGFMLRDAVFGKPKVDDIRSSAPTSDPAATESALDATSPSGNAGGDKSLKGVLHALGGLFGL